MKSEHPDLTTYPPSHLLLGLPKLNLSWKQRACTLLKRPILVSTHEFRAWWKRQRVHEVGAEIESLQHTILRRYQNAIKKNLIEITLNYSIYKVSHLQTSAF